jgi:hypothetical protein
VDLDIVPASECEDKLRAKRLGPDFVLDREFDFYMNLCFG